MVVCVIVCRFAVFGGFVRLLVVSEWFVFGCIGEFSFGVRCGWIVSFLV